MELSYQKQCVIVEEELKKIGEWETSSELQIHFQYQKQLFPEKYSRLNFTFDWGKLYSKDLDDMLCELRIAGLIKIKNYYSEK